MIAWLLAMTAFAQNDCLSSNAHPVAGTSGYHNAVTALRTNAVTYSATRFAEREVFPLREEHADRTEPHAVVVYEFNNTFNAAHTPMLSFDEGCPVDKRFATHPVDLIAANLGGVFRYGRIGGYYAAGFTLGAPSSRDRFQRYAGAVAGYPIASFPPLIFAPLMGNRMVLSGNSAAAVDSLGGVVIDAEIAEIRIGWTASSGMHLSATDPRFGLYANTVIGNGLREIGQFEAGAHRLDFGDASDKVGRTSMFGRGLPLTEGGEDAAGERWSPRQLLTGHLTQDSINGILDLAVAYALAPVPLVHEGRIGLHSPGYHELPDPTEQAARWLLQGGMVQLPAQYYYGQPGGTYIQARGEAQMVFDGVAVHVAAMINDPELLALFPFAVNALHYRLTIRGAF